MAVVTAHLLVPSPLLRGLVAADVAAPGSNFDDLVRVREYHRIGSQKTAVAPVTTLLSMGATTSHTYTPAEGTCVAHLMPPPVTRLNAGLWVWNDGQSRSKPAAINSGLLFSATQYGLRVWNNQGSQTLVSIASADVPTFSITAGPALPLWLPFCAEESWTITLAPVTTLQLSGSALVTYSIDPVYTIPLSGLCSVFFPFAPDWSVPVELDLAFDTQITVARDGGEERNVGSRIPRRALRFTPAIGGVEQVGLARKTLRIAASRPTATALWTDGVLLSSDAVPTGGPSTLNVTGDLSRFGVGSLAVIWQDYLTWSIQQITAVDGEASTIAITGLSRTYNAGTMVYPIFIAEPLGAYTATLPTPSLLPAQLHFQESLDQMPAAAAAPSVLTYRGYPIWPDNLNWTMLPSDGSNQDLVRNVYGTGAVEVYARWKQSHQTLSGTAQSFTGGQNGGGGESFFRDRLGRLQAFWVGDQAAALEALSDLAGTTLHTKAIDYLTWFGTPPESQRLDLAIVATDGTIYARRITAVVYTPGTGGGTPTEDYTLDTALTLPLSQIEKICWLVLMRFDQDVLTLHYTTDQVVEAQLAMVEVPGEVPA